MTLRCKMFGHKMGNAPWCRCKRCGTPMHTFEGCKCTRCGLTRHDWEELEDDGSFTTRRCKLCGETVKEEKVCDHEWELIDSYEDPFAISYCSGHEYVVGDPGPINIYRCKKCGKETQG